MDFIEFLKVLVLGIVEGFTEWLPISSTGHMILVDEIIHLNVTDAFMSMFRVVIQLGAILAVVILYFRRLNPLIRKDKGTEGWNGKALDEDCGGLHSGGNSRTFAGRLDGCPSLQRICGSGYPDHLRRTFYCAGESQPVHRFPDSANRPDFLSDRIFSSACSRCFPWCQVPPVPVLPFWEP